MGTGVLSADQKGPWRLREVLKLAADRVDDQDPSVQNARLELQMLEALRAWTRVEFRPQLNIFAFSNPLFLAANLASGFFGQIIGRRLLQSTWSWHASP